MVKATFREKVNSNIKPATDISGIDLATMLRLIFILIHLHFTRANLFTGIEVLELN